MIFHSTYNKPILLVGNGVRTANAVELLHKFARKTNIPVLTTMIGVDIAQDNLHIGFIGTHGNRVANMILNECDLIIAIGARLGIRQAGRDARNFAPKADLIRCDIDEYELSRNIKPNEKKYHTDARDFLHQLLNEDIPNYSKWKDKCVRAKEFLKGFDQTEGNEVVKTISNLLLCNPIVAVDVGMNQCWCAQSLHLKGDEGRIHIGGGYGTMGCGLPFAIGSSIATKNGTVFCVCGDGGFQMNIQELETVKREKLPIKIFILNNKVLGKISETQHFSHNDRFAATAESGGYTVPDFERIAEAYGIKACTLKSYKDLPDRKDWLYDNEPCLINIMMSTDSFLEPKIKFETGLIYPSLPDKINEKVINILN
ncbi:MAG: thiamine pyrophosphate-binding protein [Clostridia bacterium]|nr:thiamine pyrophosphate-binding protein [Clostridia bacterium]